jgi:hypothetical protein
MGKKSKILSEELVKYFLSDDSSHDKNLVRLKNYFGVDNETTHDGSYFESYEFDSKYENQIVSADLVAVTFLSMEMKRKSKSGISTAHAIAIESRSEEIKEILSEIPSGKELHTLSSSEFDQLIGEDSLGEKLWNLLRDKEKGVGMHRVATYKLIARKRPHLYPIRDSRTTKILGDQKNWWTCWYQALVDVPEIVDELKNLRSDISKDVSKAKDVSLLRIADIALWQE